MNYLKRLYSEGLFLRREENTSVPKYERPQMYQTIKELTMLTCPSCRGKMYPDTIVVGTVEERSFTCDRCHYQMSV